MRGLEVNLLIPDLWQQEAVRALREGKDVVVHAPTGAGKTYIFELMYPSLKQQAIFTVPTRALANDKLAEWQARGWDVGIATGDLAFRLDAKVLVATLETQKARFLRREGPGLLVIDEYQMIADPIRGVNYELAPALAPPGTQLLLLSGSVANPQDVVAWLQRIGRDARLISHKERPVPLDEVDLFSLHEGVSQRIRGHWPRLIAKALQSDLGPILIFAPRRNAAEELAQTLASALPAETPLALSPAQEALVGNRLAKLLRNRVAFHHSGLSYAARAGVVEPLAKNGQLRIVVATMGLAAGINFSMRSVLITDTRYMAGNYERYVQPDELLQMFGRAGRRGLDESGAVLITPDLPRLHDARARQLKRVTQLDWPILLSVMREAAGRGEEPFAAALEVNRRLFSTQNIPLGIEHSRATGEMPCGLWVDMERARFARRAVVEMQNSAGNWEARTPPRPTPLGSILVWDNGRWRPALSLARTLEGIGFGNLCRLHTAAGKIYGRELPLAVVGESEPGGPEGQEGGEHHSAEKQAGRPHHTAEGGHPHHFGEPGVTLVKWMRKALGMRRLPRARFDAVIVPRLSELTGGGGLHELMTRGNLLVARLDFSKVERPAVIDSHGKALQNPPERQALPIPCRGCPELDHCRTVEIVATPAYGWRRLGLVSPAGHPTRRGTIFSFFNNGEGLAVAAALEDPTYEIRDLVFDLANLRAGHRFSEQDSPFGGRLGVLCQQACERADYPGYLEMGVPINYGAGAAEIIREIVEHRAPRQKLLTELLRPGDIERALVEWRSLLRHIVWAPDYEWTRWRDLKLAAASFIESTVSPSVVELPPLLPSQQMRRESSRRLF